MLLNYRNNVHSTTNVIPAQLFFNRELKTFLPSINKKVISNLDQKIRKWQDEKYKKVKEHTDQRRKAVHIELIKGYKVLMLDNNKLQKLDSTYLSKIFEVIQVQHSTITVKNENGQQYTRDRSFFKKIENMDNKKVLPENQVTKKYPLRNRCK